MLENTIKSFQNIINIKNNNNDDIDSNNIEIINVNDNCDEEKSFEKNSADVINETVQIDHVRDFKGKFLTILFEFTYLFITTIFTAIILYFLIKMIEYIDSGDN